MSDTKTIKAVRIAADGSREEIAATLSPGHREGFDEEGVCDVDCPAIFNRVEQIIGVDQAQAFELGESFLRQMLDHHGYTLLALSDID